MRGFSGVWKQIAVKTPEMLIYEFSYTETELWKMFACLASGIQTMSLAASRPRSNGRAEMWWPWLHLDFKPMNSKFIYCGLSLSNNL